MHSSGYGVSSGQAAEQNKRSWSLVWVSTPQRGKPVFFFFLFSGPIRVGLSKQIKQKEFRDEAGYKYHKKEEHVLLAGE